ncbi:MAG: alanine--tRNA ligase [Dehalococcoidia bacterium]|nr:alanine--tRNA ligase [Dehalococcoidia bacterium]
MTGDQLREAFLRFFEQRSHQRVVSSSLIPRADPTLLFVNAGMVQFKDVFLGADARGYSRATTAQKCVRAGGKHNDLDSVGRTARHHTFFEMLGNFSFGDYFKRDAIDYAWSFVTQELGLPRDRLWITIFERDDEAKELWQEVAGVAPERILRLGEHDNFWAMGETGPCGPCSEIHYDRGAAARCSAPVCAIGVCDCDRWLEIWNLVFMQFNRDTTGTLTPLPRPSIDTGMGLERVASILQNVNTNYETDLLRPVVDAVVNISGVPYDAGEPGFPHRVIADHARACTFLISDGVLPGNEGRGYVLRRILRRAIRFGRKLGLDRPFMGTMSGAVVARMQAAYPELNDKQSLVERVLTLEEERFGQTLTTGMALLEGLLTEVDSLGCLAGRDAFRLYDTYGFPYELTEEIAREQGLTVDRAGFEAEMEQQRTRARTARRAGREAGGSGLDYDALPLPATVFLGYASTTGDARVVSIASGGAATEEATEGQKVEVVLDHTPFYGEGGGQVGDQGELLSGSGAVRVIDTFHAGRGLLVHRGVVSHGGIMVNEVVTAKVDANRRADIARNHTATHLLHAALRIVLGPHVQQAGSLVAPERLRFDFAHIAPLTRDEVGQVERLVNEKIREDWGVSHREMGFQEAVQEGALAFFDEKYGNLVRVIAIGAPDVVRPHFHPEAGTTFSKELCGGTHCFQTGEVGLFHVVSEGSVGAGIRRIEAVTGRAAEELFQQRLAGMEDIARQLGSTPQDAPARVATLVQALDVERRRTQELQRTLSRLQVDDLLSRSTEVEGVQVLAARVQAQNFEQMRELSDLLREKMASGVAVLGAIFDDRPNFLVAATKDAVARGVNAGNLVREAASVAGGGGGGRADMAQAGGKDRSKLDEALSRAVAALRLQVRP